MPTILDTLVGSGVLTVPTTGAPGYKRNLPDGWVNITYWPYRFHDDTTEYYGPVLEVSDVAIRIEVWGAPMTFLLSKVSVQS